MNCGSLLSRIRRDDQYLFSHPILKMAQSKNYNESSVLLMLVTGIARANSKSARRICISANSPAETDYSAAASASLEWADDFIKSEILGTISDRNRDPLKTP